MYGYSFSTGRWPTVRLHPYEMRMKKTHNSWVEFPSRVSPNPGGGTQTKNMAALEGSRRRELSMIDASLGVCSFPIAEKICLEICPGVCVWIHACYAYGIQLRLQAAGVWKALTCTRVGDLSLLSTDKPIPQKKHKNLCLRKRQCSSKGV